MKSDLVRSGLFALALLAAPFAQASIIVYSSPLSGLEEVPPANSNGTGSATVTIDDVLDSMRVQVTFSGLIGTTTASHIHCCTAPGANAPVATQTPTFLLFPLGVTSGSYDHTFDLDDSATYRPGFITDHGGTVALAEAALLAGLAAGQAYLNIHTLAFPGGEIRGILSQQVPEPATLALLGLGLAGLRFSRRRH